MDTRDEGSTQYGTSPGSLHIEEEELKKEIESYALTLSPGKKLVLFCQNGIHTMALQEELEKRGRDAYSLEEGYVSYLRYGSENSSFPLMNLMPVVMSGYPSLVTKVFKDFAF